jgi:hypothetical protein
MMTPAQEGETAAVGRGVAIRGRDDHPPCGRRTRRPKGQGAGARKREPMRRRTLERSGNPQKTAIRGG